MKVIILCMALSGCFVISVVAQKKGKEKLQFKMVKIPDSIKVRLVHFELGKKEISSFDSAYFAMYIYNLTESENFQFKDGLYTYRVMGPHFKRRLFFFLAGELYIFKDTSFDEVLKEYMTFYKKNNLSLYFRIKYLKAIAQYLQEEYETENN